MTQFSLADDLYIYTTPAGAYYAVASTENDKPRQFLRALLGRDNTPELSLPTLQQLMGNNDEQQCLQLLQKCQELGWVQGIRQPLQAPSGAFESILPDLLNHLGENGKILLADDQGFYLVSNGYAHEVAEELSALSAEIATVHQRRTGLLNNNLGLASHSWAIVDAAGNSQVGLWPLFIGQHRFVIVLSGVPHFNQPEFVTLTWALSVRYAAAK